MTQVIDDDNRRRQYHAATVALKIQIKCSLASARLALTMGIRQSYVVVSCVWWFPNSTLNNTLSTPGTTSIYCIMWDGTGMKHIDADRVAKQALSSPP